MTRPPATGTGSVVEDAALVLEMAAGSEPAVGVLYDRHAQAVYRIAYAIAHDRAIAEEVVQETFVALWNRAEQFDPELGSLVTWLSAIARNRALDHLRRAARHAPAAPFSVVVGDQDDTAAMMEWLAASGVVVASGAPEPGPDAAVAARETRDAVMAALQILTGPERQAIALAYWEGLSQSEIAARLGWPLGTVKTRSRRALRRLRDALEAGPVKACCADGVSA